MGKAQALRPGEVSWMTAGSGIVHSERTSLEALASGSNFFGIQAWVALPCKDEEVAADFAHYNELEIPRTCARSVEFTLITGTSNGLTSPVKTFSDMVFAEIVLTSGARYQIKPGHHERAVYVVAGEVEIVGRTGSFREAELILLEPGAEIVLKAPAFHSARLMLMGGEPFSEPRHVYWNFVSSSAERIERAKTDWRERRFPGVPGEHDFVPLPEDLDQAADRRPDLPLGRPHGGDGGTCMPAGRRTKHGGGRNFACSRVCGGSRCRITAASSGSGSWCPRRVVVTGF